MPKYIDVDAFIEKKRELYCAACERRMGVRNGHAGMIYEIGDAPCRACWVDDMLGDVEDFPASDVAPVVHAHKVTHNRPISGYWVSGDKIHNGIFQEIERVWVEPIMDNPVDYCSACGSRLDDTFQHYCPNCGAKMEAAPEEADDGRT